MQIRAIQQGVLHILGSNSDSVGHDWVGGDHSSAVDGELGDDSERDSGDVHKWQNDGEDGGAELEAADDHGGDAGCGDVAVAWEREGEEERGIGDWNSDKMRNHLFADRIWSACIVGVWMCWWNDFVMMNSFFCKKNVNNKVAFFFFMSNNKVALIVW